MSLCMFFWNFSSTTFQGKLKLSVSTFRMVGDEDDEGALSDSDGQGGLAADDLASK